MISYGRRLGQLAERHPQKVALVQAAVDGSERTVTWGELERPSEPGRPPARRARRRRGVAGRRRAPELPGALLLLLWGLETRPATVLPMRWDLPAWSTDRLVGLAKAQAVFADWPDATTPTIPTAEIDRVEAALDDGPLPRHGATPRTSDRDVGFHREPEAHRHAHAGRDGRRLHVHRDRVHRCA